MVLVPTLALLILISSPSLYLAIAAVSIPLSPSTLNPRSWGPKAPLSHISQDKENRFCPVDSSIFVKNGRCFRCNREGHFARECRFPIVCHNCGRSGHAKANRKRVIGASTVASRNSLAGCYSGFREKLPEFSDVFGQYIGLEVRSRFRDSIKEQIDSFDNKFEGFVNPSKSANGEGSMRPSGQVGVSAGFNRVDSQPSNEGPLAVLKEVGDFVDSCFAFSHDSPPKTDPWVAMMFDPMVECFNQCDIHKTIDNSFEDGVGKVPGGRDLFVSPTHCQIIQTDTDCCGFKDLSYGLGNLGIHYRFVDWIGARSSIIESYSLVDIVGLESLWRCLNDAYSVAHSAVIRFRAHPTASNFLRSLSSTGRATIVH